MEAKVTGTPGQGERFKTIFRSGGVWYSTLFLVRALTDRLRDRLDDRLAAIERRRSLVEPWTISARRFTADELRKLYNTHDWSTRGDEWTPSEEWKQGLIQEFMIPNVPEGGTVVEIGPGGGRWTEILQRRAARLIVTDVSENSIAFCRDRFRECANVDYLVGDGRTVAVPDGTIDSIWSYDVFVHVNPVDARGYFFEFARILKPGGKAIIHHPGSERVNPSRSDLTDAMVRSFCAEAGLRTLIQTSKFADKNPGDMLSVIQRPA
jgi:SAM-dependent methyltransferase